MGGKNPVRPINWAIITAQLEPWRTETKSVVALLQQRRGIVFRAGGVRFIFSSTL
jgi:hypothetical protein